MVFFYFSLWIYVEDKLLPEQRFYSVSKDLNHRWSLMENARDVFHCELLMILRPAAWWARFISWVARTHKVGQTAKWGMECFTKVRLPKNGFKNNRILSVLIRLLCSSKIRRGTNTYPPHGGVSWDQASWILMRWRCHKACTFSKFAWYLLLTGSSLQ